MNEMTPERVSARDPPRFRLMMAVAFVAVAALACIIAAALLLWRAGEERGALRQQALRTAVALSRALDQEVAAMNYLLKGLSTSPALRTGDLKAFYDQLTATPVPEGSWLILHDLEGQVLNTLRPFGAALPRHSDFRTSPVPRIRELGWAVSGRTESLMRPGASVVGLSLRVDSEGRPMTHFLTTIVSDLRLRQIMPSSGFTT
jgi:two-component system, NarL family, sensor kinase